MCAVNENTPEPALYASIPHVTDSPKWVAELPCARDPETRQLFVAACLGEDKTTASVSLHERAADGTWRQLLSTPGFIGRNGLCRDSEHKEGCGRTPAGVFHFTRAFGIADDPGSALPYTKVDEDCCWSGDEREGMHYNEMVSRKCFPGLDMTNSEHLIDYSFEYRYCLNISFNEEGTPGRGSAIFLHCMGALRPYTGGCIAVPENIMRRILTLVRADCVVVIDTLENLGGSI